MKQTRLKPLSQDIWQPPPLHPVSYQPPTHRRLLAFPVCAFIIEEFEVFLDVWIMYTREHSEHSSCVHTGTQWTQCRRMRKQRKSSRHVETMKKNGKTVFYPFFLWVLTRKSRWSRVGTFTGGNFEEDYMRFVSCHLFGPVNHGQNWKGWERSGENAWLSVIIKLKLAWLSRSMILPLGTFPWLSLSVILAKTSLKGLILIILSTYQAW